MSMSKTDKIAYVSAMLQNDARFTPSMIGVFLADAEDAILRRLYPFGIPDSVSDVPDIYERLQCKLALRYINKIGAEGEVLHAENGVDRHYGSTNEEDLLSEVTPYAKVVG